MKCPSLLVTTCVTVVVAVDVASLHIVVLLLDCSLRSQ